MTLKEDYDEWMNYSVREKKYGFFNDFEKYKISQVYAKLVHRQSLESQGFKEGGGREYKVYFDTRHNREVAFNSKEFIDLIEDDLYKEKEAKKQGKEYVLTYAKDLIPVSTVPNSDLSFRERQSYPSISQVVDELNKENTKLKQENINLKKQLEPDPTTGKTGFDLLEERDELRKEVNKLQIRQEKWQEINKLNHALREENRVLREETIKEAVSRVRLQVINGLIKRKVAGETLPIYDDNILKSLEERQGDVLDDKDPFKVISTEERTLEDWRFGYNIGGKDTPFYMYPYRINADQYNNLVGKIGKFSSEKFTYDRRPEVEESYKRHSEVSKELKKLTDCYGYCNRTYGSTITTEKCWGCKDYYENVYEFNRRDYCSDCYGKEMQKEEVQKQREKRIKEIISKGLGKNNWKRFKRNCKACWVIVKDLSDSTELTSHQLLYEVPWCGNCLLNALGKEILKTINYDCQQCLETIKGNDLLCVSLDNEDCQEDEVKQINPCPIVQESKLESINLIKATIDKATQTEEPKVQNKATLTKNLPKKRIRRK
ncbi:10368_t:CDS:2 [Funneliformis geosporum]|nr:10368_t:CDS:2 [Funneliformis geosporum]